jgi:hypothetical protein
LRASVTLALAAALLALPATASAATVSVGRSCYAEGNAIAIQGTGFTPNAGVRLALERSDGEVLESSDDPVARQDGTVAGEYGVAEETGWFTGTEARFDMTLRLTDATNPANTAATSFIFSRWNVAVSTVGGRIHPRRAVVIRGVGFTSSIGRRLYAHWMRNGRRVHTRRLGVLRGPCGDVRARLSRGFPFRPVRRGRYEVRFSPSRTNTVRRSIRHPAVRVRRRIP